MEVNWEPDPGSFRDPRAFVFWHEGKLYRQINDSAAPDFDALIDSGLLDQLQAAGDLIGHNEVPLRLAAAPPAYRVIQPTPIPFISYPYEWCFSQLKAAALLTLRLQQRALERGLELRDASAFNIQFIGNRPLLIDTLSFGRRREGDAVGSIPSVLRALSGSAGALFDGRPLPGATSPRASRWHSARRRPTTLASRYMDSTGHATAPSPPWPFCSG